jgi:O-antigen ligase
VFAETLQLRWPLVIGAPIGAVLVWAGAVEIGGNVAAVLPVGIAMAAAATFIFWQAALRKHWALLTVLVGAVFLLDISFRSRDVGDPGLDWQNGMKLLAWGGMMAICVLNASRVLRFFTEPVMMAFGSYCVICLVSAVYSPVPLVSGTAAIGMIAYLGFACVIIHEIPQRQWLLVLIWTFAAFCVVNLISGVVIPDVAYFQVDASTSPNELRFQGISGHPNALGRIATVFAMLVLAAAWRGFMRPILWVPMCLLAVGTTLVTQSRTSIFALVLAMLFQMPRRYLIPIVSLAVTCGGCILLTGQVDDVLALVGRDGSADEALSMSGRTDLWDFTWNLILDHPVTGYGFNSFESFAGTLWEGQSASSVATHNNYLSVLYSTGVVGTIPFLTGFALLLYRWQVEPDAPRDLFVINAILSGFSEIDVLSAIAPVPTLVFFLVVASDAWQRVPAASNKLTEARQWF